MSHQHKRKPPINLADLTGTQKMSADAAACVLQTSNPHAAAAAGIRRRYNANLRAEATEWYHIHEIINSSSLWPQQQLYYPLLTGPGGAVSPIGMNAKIPLNQFVTILKMNLAQRMIRSFKNVAGATTTAAVTGATYTYWFYDVYDIDGSIDFNVPVSGTSGAAESITTFADLRPGKALNFCQNLASVMSKDAGAAGGVFSSLDAAGRTLVNSWNANSVPIHGPALAANAQGDDAEFPTTIYGDSGANVSAGKDYGSGSANGTEGVVPTIPQIGGILTGSYIFYFITPPTLSGGNLYGQVSMYGDNEGQPYLIKKVDFAVPAAGVVQYASFASLQIDLDDYHFFRVSFGTTALNVTPGTEVCEIGIMYIGTGEGWSHLMTPDLLSVAAEIEMNSWIASAQLATNVTPDQYRGGVQAALQPPQGTYWQAFVDNGDPFATLTGQGNTGYRVEAIPFKDGGYFFLRPADETNYALKTEIVQASSISGVLAGPGGVGARAYRVPLQDQPFICHVINNTAINNFQAGQPIPIQNVLWHTDMVGEFTTPTQWRAPIASNTSEQAWVEHDKIIKHMKQLYTNKGHEKGLAAETKANSPNAVLENVLKWAPLLLLMA